MTIPLRNMQKDLVNMLNTAFNDMPNIWAVHVDIDRDQMKYVIVKVDQWIGRDETKMSIRFPDYDIHRVEATDEMEAYTIMQRILDELESPE